jgi:hypothetical protein
MLTNGNEAICRAITWFSARSAGQLAEEFGFVVVDVKQRC